MILPLSTSYIQTGNATSYSSVTTQVEGSSTVSTHIETTVNGQTKVLDSNTPGTYTLTNSADGFVTENTPTLSPSPTPTLPPIHKKKILSHHHALLDSIRQLLDKIFASL